MTDTYDIRTSQYDVLLDEFLNAMIAVQIYEPELPPVGPQPEEDSA